MPESKPSPVTECGALPVSVHVTVPPGAIVSCAGANSLSRASTPALVGGAAATSVVVVALVVVVVGGSTGGGATTAGAGAEAAATRTVPVISGWNVHV